MHGVQNSFGQMLTLNGVQAELACPDGLVLDVVGIDSGINNMTGCDDFCGHIAAGHGIGFNLGGEICGRILNRSPGNGPGLNLGCIDASRSQMASQNLLGPHGGSPDFAVPDFGGGNGVCEEMTALKAQISQILSFQFGTLNAIAGENSGLNGAFHYTLIVQMLGLNRCSAKNTGSHAQGGQVT